MSTDLTGKTVALLISPRGTEDPEFAQPQQELTGAGATVHAISTETGTATTVNNDLDPGEEYQIDHVVADVRAEDYDALVIPGGTVGADTLRADDGVVSFIQAFVEQGKPVASICHGPWTLIEADVVQGHTVTSFASIRTDLENAGATWVDETVVEDGGLITSRTPDDLDEFCSAIASSLSSG